MQRRIVLGVYGCAAILCLAWYGYQSYWLGQIQRFQHSHNRLYMQILTESHQEMAQSLLENAKTYPTNSILHYKYAWRRCDSLINLSLAALGTHQQTSAIHMVLQDALVMEMNSTYSFYMERYQPMLLQMNEAVTDSIELLLLKDRLNNFVATKSGHTGRCSWFEICFSPSIFGIQKGDTQDILLGLTDWSDDFPVSSNLFVVDGDTLPTANGRALYKHRFDSPGMHPVQVQLIRKNYPSDTAHIFTRTFQINVKQ